MNDASVNQGTSLNEFLGIGGDRPWYRKPLYLAGALAIILLLLLVLSGLFGGSAKPQYATEPVRRTDLTVTVSATGNLAPTNQVQVGSEQSGLIEAVYVDNNDRVTKGQPLARLDPSRLRDTLVQAQASLAAAQAQVAQFEAAAVKANSDLARMEEVSRISGGKVPAKTELDNARAQARQSAAQVRSGNAQVVEARAQVATARTNLSKATIYSPVNGVVLSRNVDPGQTVAASFQAPVLFTIAEDLSQMKLEVKVDEADVGQVKAGQPATFTVDAYPGRRFQAVIQRVDVGANASEGSTASSSASSNVVSYTAVLAVRNPDLALRPGMTATAEIVTSEKQDVLVVPNAALRFTPMNGAAQQRSSVTSVLIPRPRRVGTRSQEATIGRGSRQTVYVLAADGEPQARQLIVGDSNGALTEVIAGNLRPGEKVITGQLAGKLGAPASRGQGPRQNAALPPLLLALAARRKRTGAVKPHA
jgi:HlyD family secretion protein